MIVFGDRVEKCSLDAAIADLRLSVQQFLRGSIAQRDTARTDVVLRAAALAQGLLDARFEQRGYDEADALSDCVNGVLQATGELFVHVGNREGQELLRRIALLEAAAAPLGEPELQLRTPEGHAYYAVYLELYEAAARRCREQGSAENLMVIGIRTIGTSLAAVVSAAMDARHGLFTVRPRGHPFARALAIGPELERRIRTLTPGAAFAIVDEGPGASGSSFGCVVDWLLAQGAERGRIHLFPSHGGAPGPHASPALRDSWGKLNRHVHSFETWFGLETRDRLIAPSLEPMDAGTWRDLHGFPQDRRPPCFLQQEHRKYRTTCGQSQWIARFVGLGSHGQRAERTARILASRGLAPPVIGLRHGFLVSVWSGSSRPLPLAPAVDRQALLDTLVRYLQCRVLELGPARSGSSPRELLAMAIHNATERFGRELTAELRRFDRVSMCRLEAQAAPVITDNRLHPWEWLVNPDESLWKVDCTDHHAAHDCIGCQDVAWDVAGAVVELALSQEEAHDVEERLAAVIPYKPCGERRSFYALCYLAFQLGYYAEAATTTASHDAEEAVRLEAAANRYAARLYAELSLCPSATRS